MKYPSVLLTALTITLTPGLVHAQSPLRPGGPPPPAAGAPLPPDPNGPPPPATPNGGSGAATATAQGTYSRRGVIKAFNSGPEGETNGVILNDGTVVLFPPQSGAQLRSVVKEGSSINFAGVSRSGASGRTVIKAQSITANGQTIAMPASPGAQPGPSPTPNGPPPPADRGRGRGPGGPPPPPQRLPAP